MIFTRLAMIAATKFRVLDYPDGRKLHTEPVPLLGGIAIFAAFAGALLINFHFSRGLKGIVIASFFIMAAGLQDDVKGLSALARLLIQILCSLLVVSFGVRLDIIPDVFPFARSLETVLTVLWIVGITNALNFLDGIDGLAAGFTVIAAGAFFVIAYQTGQMYFAYLNITLAGACLGFLTFNFYPARIFLGDAGSGFLGFCLASLAVMGEWARNRPVVALGIPLLILAVLVFDMVYITVSRIARKKVRTFKEWIEYVDKDHLHHRLLGMGFTRVQTVLFIYMIQAVFALGALVLKKATTFQAVLLLCQGLLVLIIIAVLMIAGRGRVERDRFNEHGPAAAGDDAVC